MEWATATMARFHDHCGKSLRLQHIVKRLPVRSCAFHGDHFAPLLLQPIRQQKQFSRAGSKFPDFLLFSRPQVRYGELLVNVYPTTALVYSFHSIPSILGIAAQLSFFLYFSFRPFVLPYWTIRGAARELFVNFVFDLRYQKRDNLFRCPHYIICFILCGDHYA